MRRQAWRKGAVPAAATVVQAATVGATGAVGRMAADSSRKATTSSSSRRGQRVALGGDQPAGHPGQHPGIGARLDGGGRAAGGHVDQDADHPGRHQEDQQRQHVAGVGDGERVDGWGEVVVRQQEPDDRGQEGRPHPAGGGHGHHQQQVGAERGRQVGVGTGGRQQQGEQRKADDAEEHGTEATAGRQGRQQPATIPRMPGARWRLGGPDFSSEPSSAASVAMTCTSSAPPAARITELMTEPRTNSDRRLRWVAPMTSWVAFSARATWTRAGATSAPTTST